MFNTDEISYLNNYIDNYIREQQKKYNGNKTMEDKISHILRCNMLTALIDKENDMALLGCKFHDIGRFLQYEKLGKFDDRYLSHNLFGEFFLQNEIKNGRLKTSYELDTVRLVSMYHGLEDLIPERTQLSQEVLECIRTVSVIDEIDNGCIAALGYLEHEVETDAKNFISSNPGLDMTTVSPEVFEYFVKGEKFDKSKYCKTYADYILFACLLAIKSLKGKHYKIAKTAMMQSCYIYDNALEGYRDLFNKFIEPKYASICFDILVGYYLYSKDYIVDREKINLGISVFSEDYSQIIENIPSANLNLSKN